MTTSATTGSATLVGQDRQNAAAIAFGETTRRKSGFVPGLWVRLGDGTEWSIPPAGVTVIRFGFEDDTAKPVSRTAIPVESDLEEKIDEIIAQDDEFERVRVAAGLISRRLTRNYNLSPEEIAILLPVVVRPETGEIEDLNALMWGSALFAVCGLASIKFDRTFTKAP